LQRCFLDRDISGLIEDGSPLMRDTVGDLLQSTIEMIARFFVYLPYDLLITEEKEWPAVDLIADNHRARIYAPAFYAERPEATGSVLRQMNVPLKPPAFTENLLVNGKRVAPVNVLVLDFMKSEFDRSEGTKPDPTPMVAFEIANEYLDRIRVYSRDFQIKPVVVNEDGWRLRYLADDGQELETEPGKLRGRAGFTSTIGLAAVTPEAVQMVGDRWQGAEPYAWDRLLLDARALLPDVGSAIVIAAAALETFIVWALNILHEGQPLPNGLWSWINNRDHWTKEPSASEEFDSLLRVFTGRSLKDDEPSLWQQYSELRRARNALVHDGVSEVGRKPVDPAKAKLMVDAAEKIIAWVEGFVPERHRRARTSAVGPFSRRLATQQEGDSLGPAHVAGGSLGLLPPGGTLAFAFDPKPDVGHKSCDQPMTNSTDELPPKTGDGTST
jgi:hypothetical protein